MPNVFHPIKLRTLSESVTYAKPLQDLPENVKATSPAMDVMTDLKLTSPVTISSAKTIDSALQAMIHKGVRMLLVEDLHFRMMGLITANDIQGEKPILFVQKQGITRGETLVRDIMMSISTVEALDFIDVNHSKVGDIIKTMTQSGRQHALVVESREGDQEKFIRGIFSTSQISRQMGIAINPTEKAQTFAELERAIV